MKWESEVDSTFTLPLWKVESERSEVRKWGRLDFYSAVVKSRVNTRLFHCRCEKSSRREVKWESEVDSTFTLPLWKVESERSEVRKWGRLDFSILDFFTAVVKSRVGEKWSDESEVDSTFPLPLWKVESERSEVRKWGRLDFYSAVVKSRVGDSTFSQKLRKVESRLDFYSAAVKSRVGEKWSEKVR